jgi:hypothetical protein
VLVCPPVVSLQRPIPKGEKEKREERKNGAQPTEVLFAPILYTSV